MRRERLGDAHTYRNVHTRIIWKLAKVLGMLRSGGGGCNVRCLFAVWVWSERVLSRSLPGEERGGLGLGRN